MFKVPYDKPISFYFRAITLNISIFLIDSILIIVFLFPNDKKNTIIGLIASLFLVLIMSYGENIFFKKLIEIEAPKHRKFYFSVLFLSIPFILASILMFFDNKTQIPSIVIFSLILPVFILYQLDLHIVHSFGMIVALPLEDCHAKGPSRHP